MGNDTSNIFNLSNFRWWRRGLSYSPNGGNAKAFVVIGLLLVRVYIQFVQPKIVTNYGGI
jgi:hypothetical protein